MNNAAPPGVAAAMSAFCHHSEAAVNAPQAQPKSGPMPTMLPKSHTRLPTSKSEANSGSTARAGRETPTNVTRRSIASISCRASLSLLSDSLTFLWTSESLSVPNVLISSPEPLKIVPEAVHGRLDGVIEVFVNLLRKPTACLLPVEFHA